MSVPQPTLALEGHCSAISDDTLYVLSPAGLQSLPLKQNATWTQEPNGEAVTGPACVTAIPNGDASQAALYVIGGSSKDDNYSGLQRYFFGNKTWETLPTLANVLQSRTSHSAAYLNDSQSILVYAGSQPDAPSDMSSQTFVIHTQPPYNIEAFTSQAPPTNLPILEPWNSSHAVMLGGSDWNTAVYTFGTEDGWQPLGTNLSEPVDSAARGTILSGSDGSKVLELYDVSVSPNVVSQIVLADAGGATAATGQTIGGKSLSRKRKRDLTLNNWPSYNTTGAPTATRTDCSVAQGQNGLAVIAAGSSDAPVALFDQSGNNWVDASQFFNVKDQQPLQPSSTTDTPTSATPTASSKPSKSSSSSDAAGGLSAHDRMLRTLGITLGVLCGIAAVFILILLFLRWRKSKHRKDVDYPDEKAANRLSFADRGASFMKEAGGSAQGLAPPTQNRYDDRNSLAIIAGKFGNKRETGGHQPKSSYESTARLVKGRDGNYVSPEPVEMLDIGEKTPIHRKPVPPSRLTPFEEKEVLDEKEDRSRSSGWSKYFATSGPTGPNGISHLPAAYLKPHTASATTYGSHYSDSQTPSLPSRIPSSALVPPLDIDFSRTIDGQRLSHVTSGSPSFSDSREDLARNGSTTNITQGQKGLIVDPNSDRRSQISGHSLSSYNRTTISSNLTNDFFNNDSGNTPWTPVSTTFKDLVNNSRPTSSNYTNSVIEPRVPSRGKGSGGFFPGAGTSYRPPPKTKLSSSAAPTSDWAAPHPANNTHTTAGAQQQQQPPPGLTISRPAEDRDSTLTVFPRGVPSAYYANRPEARKSPPPAQRSNQKAMVSDMSWLNLGLGGGNQSQNRI